MARACQVKGEQIKMSALTSVIASIVLVALAALVTVICVSAIIHIIVLTAAFLIETKKEK